MKKPISFVILGAGQRGLEVYGNYIKEHPEKALVTAVAEPIEARRRKAARVHNIKPEHVFSSWKEILEQPKLADAAIIATPDKHHFEPALALLKKGYHLRLEKPMATSEEEVRKIVEVTENSKLTLSVAHVLRYTKYFQKIREIIASGKVGNVISINHIEHIGYEHYAHSFVRGNWASSKKSAPMILTKACHDMDILLFLLGKSCKRVSSFGSLSYFKNENKPTGAANRCLDCSLAQDQCAYSASKFYLKALEEKKISWPIAVITEDHSEEGVLKALQEGPYGRCVYSADNDVVDHQVVSLEFEDGISANFTMTAFTAKYLRRTNVYCSNAEIEGTGSKIKVRYFDSQKEEVFDYSDIDKNPIKDHLDGDAGIMHDFIEAIATNDPEKKRSSARESLESHLIAFAAERARLNGTVEEVHL